MAKDDAIAVKTRKPPAITERLTVRKCIVASNASASKVGTEAHALIRAVTFENCEVFDSGRGIILYAREGGPIEKVTWRNIRMHLIDWPHETRGASFQFLITRSGGATPFRDCLVENVETNARVASSLAGPRDAPLDGLTMRTVTVQLSSPAEDEKPPLFSIGPHVNVSLTGLKIFWHGNRAKRAGVVSGTGLQVIGLSEDDLILCVSPSTKKPSHARGNQLGFLLGLGVS